MSEDLEQSIQMLVRMIDSINSMNSLASLSFNLTIISICSQRLTGAMPKQMELLVEAAFAECDEITSQEPYERAREIFAKARATWDESKPAEA